MKRILACVFALMLLLPLCAMRADAAEVIAEYKPDDANLQWYLTDDGVLTFTAHVESAEYISGTPADWSVHKDMITKVVFDGNVSYVMQSAFYGYKNLKEVVFNGTVGEIGSRAFASSGLEEV